MTPCDICSPLRCKINEPGFSSLASLDAVHDMQCKCDAKVFDTCHKHIGAVKEIRQLTDPLKYQKYFTVLYCVQMEWSPERSTVIEWQLPDLISDELLMPARLVFENCGGIELRQGRCPGICELFLRLIDVTTRINPKVVHQ